MPAEPALSSSASQDLRKQVALRLGVAALVLVGITVAMIEQFAPSSSQEAASVTQTGLKSQASDRTERASPANDAAIGESKRSAAATAEPPSAAALAEGPSSVQTAATPQSDAVPLTGQEAEAGVAVAPVLASAASAVAKLPSGAYLQVGVFMHPANAEELKTKLLAQGLPVHTAIRVQVGPFKNQEQAQQALETLKGLGFAAVPVRQ